MARRSSRQPRRGVVLLVILSLLVLFALLGVTFVLVSGQYKRSAASFARAEMYGDDWARQLDTAMYMALRDTLDPLNPIRTHSLLHDVYGHEYFYGTVTTPIGSKYGGQIGTFSCSVLNDRYMAAAGSDSQKLGYFNGCVLTFYRPAGTAGNQLGGTSVRIIRSSYSGGKYEFQVMRPTPDHSNDTALQDGDRFVINGRAFAGTGAGYSTSSGKLSASLVTAPNRYNAAIDSYLTGGANENWDAADLQNLFLSATIPDPTHPTGIKHFTVGMKEYPCILPSFHRPALINGSPSQTNSFRAPGLPDFENAEWGPWDVDTDGDGLADSIWMDVNLPVQTSPDGRRYKPLIAMKIADMDGRLNVNFHGNDQHAEDPGTGLLANRYRADGKDMRTRNPYKGAGLGPPEVRLGLEYSPLANPTAVQSSSTVGLVGLTKAQHNAMLSSASTGRYGPDQVPGSATMDSVMATRVYEIAGNVYAGAQTSYHSPPDLLGRLALAVDARGHRNMDGPDLSKTAQWPTPDHRLKSVYRTRIGSDRRFTPAELERILRYYDIDAAQLPSRLEAAAGVLSGGSGQYAFNRQIVTTASYDMPVSATGNLASTGHAARRDVLDLLRAKGLPESALMQLVDRDLFFGLKMNLNRPLGDGVDSFANVNQQNYVVDEEDSSEAGKQFAAPMNYRGANGADLDGSGAVDVGDELLVRQQLATHLYVLASLCVDSTATEVQHYLAQWAVNVVDFRDADSIMTRFDYDVDPLNGPWTITHRVWGMERPELLLTETIVTHDRRTSDEPDEDPVDEPKMMPGTTTEDVEEKKDEDYDQKYMPEGAAFIEIYNPWQSSVERQPAEFYYDWSSGWKDGVRLDQRSRQGNSPVWRILVVKGAGIGRDPDDPDNAKKIDDDDKERTIYFVNPSGVTDASETVGKPYFPDPNPPIAPLLPGRYAVVGSGPISGVGTPPKYTTYFGFKTDATLPDVDPTSLTETRRIVLSPSDDATVNQVEFLNNSHTDPKLNSPDYSVSPLTVAPTIAVVLNRTVGGTGQARFSLSEPTDDYAALIPASHQAGAPNSVGIRTISNIDSGKPLDNPLDDTDGRRNIMMKDGMHLQYRALYLQRLANPLLPHNKDTNPYLTIDATGADLACFNGIQAGTEPGAGDGPNATKFESLQRGDPPSPASPLRQLWRRNMSQTLTAAVVDDGTHHWPYHLHHTLGYLNSSYGPHFTANTAATNKGDPLIDSTNQWTFPWLTWNNRPFNSVYELMEVPWTRSSQLTDHYSIPPALLNPYDLEQNQLGNSPPPVGQYQRDQFGHLLNFYYGQNTPAQVNGLYRLFDYLRIPSKFVEADTMLNAQSFIPDTYQENQFHAPHNWLSNWRDPGMININTIYSANVWNAILGGDVDNNDNDAYGLGPSFNSIVRSRRGYGSSTEILERSGSVPTEFANPFRAVGTGRVDGITEMDPDDDIDVTFLRKDPNNNDLPLLGNNNNELDSDNDTNTYNHSARHPYFRHQTLQRLSNTLTTRSNVYACWITIGYFEVDTSGAIGQELNADTGEIKRHRSFYLIDRSIPVGFEPGENHNVDRAILVRRYIE